MNPSDLMARIGAARPPVDTGLAAGLLKPVIEGGQAAVHIPKEAFTDPTIGESLSKMGNFLPAMGLAVIKAPDGGAYVFDPRRADPKELMAGKIVSARAGDDEKDDKDGAPQAPAAPSAPGNLAAAAGVPKVNQERAQNLQSPSPASGKGMLGVVTKRAF